MLLSLTKEKRQQNMHNTNMHTNILSQGCFLCFKSHQPLVAGWFRMLNCSYTLPSFPSGKGLPFPLPPSRTLAGSAGNRSLGPGATFWLSWWPSFFHHFFDAFLDRFLLDFRPQLASQNPPKSLKNRCQDEIHLGFHFLIDF